MELFQKLNDDGVTIVMITHDPVVAGYAKRVVDIFDGEISERSRAAKNQADRQVGEESE